MSDHSTGLGWLLGAVALVGAGVALGLWLA